jgi:hypothetical protein
MAHKLWAYMAVLLNQRYILWWFHVLNVTALAGDLVEPASGII